MAVAFECDGDRMTVIIRDDGRAFDPQSIAPPNLESRLDEREPGGLGWHLIRASVDEFRYESDSAGNRLTLVRSVKPPGKP